MAKKGKKLLALMLVAALVLGGGKGEAIQAAEDYGVKNPVNTMADGTGITTWDCVYFGNYAQKDTNHDGKVTDEDEKEPIKWRVLSVEEDGTALLLADKLLDKQPFDENETGSWENATIRTWLNSTFLNTAFTEAEQEAIADTELEMESGTTVTDNIYLLSMEEVSNPEYGFHPLIDCESNTRKAESIKYNATDLRVQLKNCWWLRLLQGNELFFVSAEGKNGRYYDGKNPLGIRPALRLKLSDRAQWSYAGTTASEELEVTVENPAAGSPFPYTVKGSENIDTDRSTVFWQKKEDGKWVDVAKDETAQLQQVYRACVTLKAKEGSLFSEYDYARFNGEQVGLTKKDDSSCTLVCPVYNYGVKNPVNPEADGSGTSTWDCVYFGKYYQNDTNGDGKVDETDEKEPVKWRVLSVDLAGNALLMADKILDYRNFNDNEAGDIDWGQSDMRKWLNSDGASEKDPGFLQTAFTEQEQAVIRYTEIETIVLNEADILKTWDSVFLLSYEDAWNTGYGFHANNANASKNRVAESTAYAAAKQQTVEDQWWLRTYVSMSLQGMACRCFIEPEGSYKATAVQSDTFYGVRPALYINLADFTKWTYAGTVDADGNTKEPVQLSVDSPVHGRGFYAETMGFHEADWAVAAENWQKKENGNWVDVGFEEMAEAEGVYRLRTQVIAEKENMDAPCVLNQGKYAQVEANDDGTFTVYCTFSNYGLADPLETEEEGKQMTTWDTIWVTDSETEKETPMKWRVLSVDAYGNITLVTDPSMGGEERERWTNLSRITDWSYAGKVDSEGGSEEILPRNLYLSATVETPETGKNLQDSITQQSTFVTAENVRWEKKAANGADRWSAAAPQEKVDPETVYAVQFTASQKQAAAVFHKNTRLHVTVNGKKALVTRDADGNYCVRYEFAATAGLPPTPSAAPTVSPSAMPTPSASGTPTASNAPTPNPTVSSAPTGNLSASAAPGTTAQPGEAGQPQKPEETTAPGLKPAQKGEKLQDESGAVYVVTKADSKNPEVAYQKAASTKGTVVVPDTVVVNGMTYKVTSIEKKAFGTGKKIKTIVLGKNVKFIKKDAFAGCKTLRKIIVKTKKLTKKTVAKKAFRGVRKNVRIVVPKKKKQVYRKLFYQRGLNKKVKIRS